VYFSSFVRTAASFGALLLIYRPLTAAVLLCCHTACQPWCGSTAQRLVADAPVILARRIQELTKDRTAEVQVTVLIAAIVFRFAYVSAEYKPMHCTYELNIRKALELCAGAIIVAHLAWHSR
jgi:hypothetical protein